jgi:hypothetical protein
MWLGLAIVGFDVLVDAKLRQERLRPNSWSKASWTQVFLISVNLVEAVTRVIRVAQGARMTRGLACGDVVARVMSALPGIASAFPMGATSTTSSS